MKLSPYALECVQQSMVLIKQHQTSLDALKRYISAVIKSDTGADIDADNYEFDPSTGELHPTTEEGASTDGTP